MKIALLFPGQGSQVVGMGRDVFEASALARAAYEEADRALGEPISTLCFQGPESDLTLTANTQPALVATSAALLEALRERAPSLPVPFCAAGHSLGEYSSLVAAGALGLGDAVRLVRARGKAMQEAVPAGAGAMAAVMGLTADEVEALCAEAAQGDVVTPANFNGTQVVIAGSQAAVARAQELVLARGGKVIPLKVSAPFHCALMQPAARLLEPLLGATSFGAMRFPVVANVDAQPNSDVARLPSLLTRQIDGVVRWEASVRWMLEQGVTLALEVGPGKVLAGLCKRIDKRLEVLPCGDLASIDAAAKAISSRL